MIFAPPSIDRGKPRTPFVGVCTTFLTSSSTTATFLLPIFVVFCGTGDADDHQRLFLLVFALPPAGTRPLVGHERRNNAGWRRDAVGSEPTTSPPSTVRALFCDGDRRRVSPAQEDRREPIFMLAAPRNFPHHSKRAAPAARMRATPRSTNSWRLDRCARSCRAPLLARDRSESVGPTRQAPHFAHMVPAPAVPAMLTRPANPNNLDRYPGKAPQAG